MKLSGQQDAALRSIDEWYRSDRQVGRVFGYAGTGKTTLAKRFAENVEGDVLYSAPTGKAAQRMRQVGCAGACTLHSLIYNSRDRSRHELRELERALVETRAELVAEGATPEQVEANRAVRKLIRDVNREREKNAEPLFSLNQDSDVSASKLIIVDEGSMVDDRVGEDLLSFGTKVLVLGDPAQLPPVRGAGFFTNPEIEPDVMLTEIHRQAEDNPIIALATRVRQRERIDVGNYGSSRVTDRRISAEEALAADQVLVGRNKTRRAVNRRTRSLQGRGSDLPEIGERLVCLRNDHSVGLLNGGMWRVLEAAIMDEDAIALEIKSLDIEDLENLQVQAHTQPLLDRPDAEPLGWWDRKGTQEFAYGYALTVHKAQGSQWDNVVLYDESGAFRQDAWRWLYTGLTRAAERITVVRA